MIAENKKRDWTIREVTYVEMNAGSCHAVASDKHVQSWIPPSSQTDCLAQNVAEVLSLVPYYTLCSLL